MRNPFLIGISLVSCLFFTTQIFAQKPKMNLYEKNWESLQKLEDIGQTKTALDSLQKFLPKIQADVSNPAQQALLIKAAFYFNKYQAALEEDGLVKAIYRFEQQTDQATGVAKSLMLSILAEMYDQYLMNNLYKYQDRTAVDNSFKQEDIRTWDVRRISERVFALHQQALQNEASKSINLLDYEPILSYASNAQPMQPTLYDFIATRAIDFFASEKNYLTQPAYKFYVEQPEALADLNTFLGYKFSAKDSLSGSFQALRIYQQLLDFHKNDADQTALIMADLRRLNYSRGKSVLSNKDELYIAQLQNMESRYGNSPAAAEISYQIAVYYFGLGNSYITGNKTELNRWDKKKALEIAEKAIAKSPKSMGASNCLALINSIKAKELSVQIEEVSPIQKPILASIDYQNVGKVYFKVIPAPESVIKRMESKYDDDLIKYLNALTPKDRWETELIDEKDYQNHRLEVKIPAQASGNYILMVSGNKNFDKIDNGLFYNIFTVSDINLVSRSSNGGYENDFYVTNRITGKPLQGAKLEYYTQNYNAIIRLYEYKKIGNATTDKNGFANGLTLEKDNYRNYRVKVTYNNDELYTEDNFYSYKSYNNSSILRRQTYFFLDRAIYRPGQTIYFKGILVEYDKENRNPKILANTSTTVTFFDANYQKVADVVVKTNEYGSYQGTFVAPASGLTGQMSLVDALSNSNQIFRVEEYKRPQFAVSFLPIDKSYGINEKVSVKGEAKAYAGNKIDGGKVQYRVVRQARFPYWPWWRWGANPYKQEQQEIIFGETKTDENGQFTINFDAIPDKAIPAKDKPQFTYTIYADVTDVTGETRSSQSSVTVGYVLMNVNMEIPSFAEKIDFNEIVINSSNLNGQPEPAKGSIVIEKLKTPTVAYQARRWSKPDYFVVKEEEFRKDFPQLAYKNEDESTSWAVEKETFKADFDTKTDKSVKIDAKSWAQGTYKATLKTADKAGEAIELVEYFTLYSAQEKTVPNNEQLFVPNTAFLVEPDSSISVDFGAYDANAYVLAIVEFDGKLIYEEWIQPKGRQQIPVKITEQNRGGIHFQLYSAQNNRSYESAGFITVPFSNKELKIEYETFRDKLYPGQEEEWKVKISGLKADKIAAEMVAGMYDASLDAFAANNWAMSLYSQLYRTINLNSNIAAGVASTSALSADWNKYVSGASYYYAILNWHGFNLYDYSNYYLEDGDMNISYRMDEPRPTRSRAASPDGKTKAMKKMDKGGTGDYELEMKESNARAESPTDETFTVAVTDANGNATTSGEKEKTAEFDEVKIRTNLNETVFFFPQMQTDEKGSIIIKFKMNESLTKWKFMALAHTKDLAVGKTTREIVTQKDLMVQPNAPRFFRQDDQMEFTAKISNLTKTALTGKVVLQLFNASTMQPIDALFANQNNTQDFSVEGDRSIGLSWKINIPTDYYGAVCYRVIAKSNNFSDGEESSLPVISNRMLLTETQPLPIRGGQTKVFDFKRMAEVSKSPTMRHHQLTLEFTQNPAWYAVQSLPYLIEYPYECTEQLFSRFYANSLGSSIANSHPRIKQVFDQWKNIDPNALKSNLHKNQELKYALLEETPWVLAAESEAQQKRNVGLLFDLNRMGNELASARDKMADRQLGNGGFAWFKGGRDDWYITQYIVEGMGHLAVLNVKTVKEDSKVKNMMSRAVNYLDNRIEEHYEELKRYVKKTKDAKMEDDHLDYMAIHYLYARSFYLEQEISKGSKEAVAYYMGQAKKYWANKSMYMKGLIALALHRNKETEVPALIVRAAKENALNSEEMGMYWKYPSGYYWYEMPIESHALMIEMFDEVAKDSVAVDELKTWLLKAKQTTNWKTTKATAAACYVLLRMGDNWLLEDKEISIKLGNTTLDQSKIQKEAGTGYFKTTFPAAEIKPEMSKITVSNPNKVVAWGAMYWQYFEQLDKVTDFKETPLKLNKQLFKEVKTDAGLKLVPINAGDKLKVGDLVKVRVELFVDRDMEYVHMKDMRAAAFEPINVLSQYKYQGGLGYYESTKDAATNFFFSYLSKGSYVFEYPLRVQYKGNYSNGVTTIQCMYAPEFTAHSNGVRVTVE